MATIIQADLKELGINVKVVPMEFRALGNFRPAVLDTSGLWNADQLFLRPRAAVQRTSR
jgi:ABC-type transport system substrate-binding protein